MIEIVERISIQVYISLFIKYLTDLPTTFLTIYLLEKKLEKIFLIKTKQYKSVTPLIRNLF